MIEFAPYFSIAVFAVVVYGIWRIFFDDDSSSDSNGGDAGNRREPPTRIK